MTDYTRYIWKLAGGKNPTNYFPTKDYATAKKLLPIAFIPSDRRKILQIMKNKKLLGDPKDCF